MFGFPSLIPAISDQPSAISDQPHGRSGLSGLFRLFGLSGLSGWLLRLAPSVKRVFHHPSFILLPLSFFLTLAPWALSLAPLTSASAAEVRLAWDPNPEPDVAGYVVYYGNASRNYQYHIDVGKQTTATLTNLAEGQTYYFSVTAYDSFDNESAYSNEVIHQVPPTLPSCTFAISPASQSFNPSGGTGAVNVTTQAGCAWTAASNASWVVRTSNSSMTGSGTVNYSVLQNSGSSSRTGTMTIAGKTFNVTQAGQSQIQYTLTISRSGNGTGAVASNPSGSSFNEGTLVTLSATPDANSVFAGWSGACTGISAACSLTMDSNKAVTATFSLKTYTISATTGANGAISPQGTVTVSHGANQIFSITPNPSYRIEDVKVDGFSVGPVSSYAFANVTKNHTIQATFTAISYSLSINKVGTGTGTITTNPSGTFFAAGTSVILSASPDNGSTFSGWSGACSGTSSTCSTTMDSDKSITATFVLKTYTITASAGPNGAINPQGLQTVNHGSSLEFTVTPNAGYRIEDVKVDDHSIGPLAKFILSNITSNRTVTVTFSPSFEPLNLLRNGGFESGNLSGWERGGGITIDPQAKFTGNFGAKMTTKGRIDQRFKTIVGNTYHVSARVRIDRELVSPSWGGLVVGIYDNNWQKINASPYMTSSNTPIGIWQKIEFSFVARTTTTRIIYQNFSKGQFEASADEFIVSPNPIPERWNSPFYIIAAQAGTGGTVSPNGAVSVSAGTNQTFAFAASPGYHIFNVQVDGQSIGPVSSYTFQNVAANHTISASFAPDNTSANLLLNGGFESGNLSGWENGGGISVTDQAKHGGAYGAQMTTTGRIDQTFNTVVGMTYSVSAKIRIDRQIVASSWGGLVLQIYDSKCNQLASSPFLTPANSSLGIWNMVNFTFAATTPLTRLIFQNFSKGQFEASADDFVVSPSSSP